MARGPARPDTLSDDRLALAIKAAELYFIDGLDQSAIGRMLNCSPPTVSRLLKEARQLGIVQVQIQNPRGRVQALEAELRDRWNLLHVLVVAGRFDDEAARKVIGHATARVLDQWISPRSTGGISLGKTVFEVTESLKASPADLGVHVVPLVGGLNSEGVEYQANELARRMADALGGSWQPLNIPALASSPAVRDLLLGEPAVQEMVQRWRTLDWVLLSIGPETRVSHLVSTHDFTSDEREALAQSGAVGDICGRFFDDSGRECATFSRRLVAIDYDTLTRVPLRIGAAAGPHKRRAIRGALTGRWVNALVTDEATAAELVHSPTS